MHTQSSNNKILSNRSGSISQFQGFNPNEAVFQRNEKNRYLEDQSEIIRDDNQLEESQFSSSYEDIDIESSSSSPTGSEDLLDAKFLTPRNNEYNNLVVNKCRQKELILEKPVGYGLLQLPKGSVLEYEIPK